MTTRNGIVSGSITIHGHGTAHGMPLIPHLLRKYGFTMDDMRNPLLGASIAKRLKPRKPAVSAATMDGKKLMVENAIFSLIRTGISSLCVFFPRTSAIVMEHMICSKSFVNAIQRSQGCGLMEHTWQMLNFLLIRIR